MPVTAKRTHMMLFGDLPPMFVPWLKNTNGGRLLHIKRQEEHFCPESLFQNIYDKIALLLHEVLNTIIWGWGKSHNIYVRNIKLI